MAQGDKKQKIYQFGVEDLYQFNVVSASKKKQTLVDAPAIIDVVTSDEISQKGFNSVAEALAAIPGLFVTSDHVTFNVSVRGINGGFRASSRSLKVMINGQPISFRATSENFIGPELIPLALIKRIEVIRGPASTLYGANAFLGVINIITKTGDELNKTYLSYGNGINFNNNNLTSGNFSLTTGYKLKKKSSFVFGISSGVEDRSGLRLPFVSEPLKEAANGVFEPKAHDVESNNDISRPITVFGSLQLNSNLGRFNTEIHFQKLDNNGKFYDANPVLNDSRISIHNYFIKESFSRELIKEKLSLNTSFSFAAGGINDNDKIDLGHPGDITGVFVKRNMSYSSFDFTLIADYFFNNNFNMLFGVDYSNDSQELFSYDKRSNQNGQIVVPVKEVVGNNIEDVFKNIGVYTQGIWSISEHKNLTFGMRYDNHNIYGSKLSGRLAGTFSLTSKWYAKALIGTSFRAPTASQLYAPEPYNLDTNIGERNLEPENAMVFELTAGVALSEHISLNANAFYNLLDKLVVYTKESESSSLVPENKNDITTLGAELSLKWQAKAFSGALNLSYQNSKDIDDNKAELFPDLMFNGNVNYASKYLNVNLQGTFVNSYIASQNNISTNVFLGKVVPYNIDSYFIADLVFSSNNLKLIGKKETKFSISVKNILNKDFSYPGFFKYDIPNLGRRLRVKITQEF